MGLIGGICIALIGILIGVLICIYVPLNLLWSGILLGITIGAILLIQFLTCERKEYS